jgi:hypothetical protein
MSVSEHARPLPPARHLEMAPASGMDRLLARLLRPVDIASLVLFRIGFGSLMAWWAWDYLASGRVRFLYVEPRFHFTYYGYDWVQPWPGPGMYLHFVGLALLGVAIAFGCCYRLAAALFAAGFTYVFLLDATNYQNHYYLIMLLSWLLVILPLNRAVSFDAARWPAITGWLMPTWARGWFALHCFALRLGGVAKLDRFQKASPSGRCLRAVRFADYRPLLTAERAVALVVWGGLLSTRTCRFLWITRALGLRACSFTSSIRSCFRFTSSRGS